MSRWVHRTRTPRELRELEEAARELEKRSPRAPGPTGPVFAKVSDVVLIATAVISSTLAAVHLYKALFPQHREHSPSPRPRPASAGQSRPDYRRRLEPALAAGDEPHERTGRNR